MSDLFKFAYVRGAQNALVKAGALEEYPTVEAADIAVKLAAYRITNDPTGSQVSNLDMSNAMADLVAFGAKTANEIMQAAGAVAPEAAAAMGGSVAEALEDAAQAQAEAAAQMMEVADQMEGGGMTSLAAARQNVARLKAASETAIGAEASALGGKGQEDLEADQRPEGYANNGGAPIDKKIEPVAPYTSSMHDHSAGMTSTASVNLDPKTAAAILRKLAGGAVGAEASELGGKGQGDEEEDQRGDEFAHGNTQAKVDAAAPGTGEMKDVSEGITSEPGAIDETPGGKVAAAAYETLLKKTAAEVGHHLPTSLTSTEKLAALRTMMGMTSGEQIDYLNRLNQAVKMAMADMESGEEEDEKEDAQADEKPESSEEAAKDEDKESKDMAEAFAAAEEESEKKSEAILRNLGLGL